MGSTAGEGQYVDQMAGVGYQEPRQRKDFPETWIWLDANMRYVCHHLIFTGIAPNCIKNTF